MDVTIPCPCPGAPHPEGDTVTLRDKVSLPMGLGTTNMLVNVDRDDDVDAATLTGRIAQVWIMEGISAWTLVDEKSAPIPPDREHIRAFMADWAVVYPVADAAASLYSEAILAPLVMGNPASSPDGPTDLSISAKSVASPKRRSPSEPSSLDTSEVSTPSTE